MSPSTIGAIGVLALFTLLLLRVPVWIALTLVGFCGNAIMSGVQPSLIPLMPFSAAQSAIGTVDWASVKLVRAM